MLTQETNHRILQIVEGTLENALPGFFIVRKSRGLSKRTIAYYEEKLFRFLKYANNQGIEYLYEIQADFIRLYILHLSETCNNGGVHAHYRVLRSFFNWYEKECDDFNNPISKISPPKVNHQPKEGITIQNVMKMVNACTTANAARDKAILLTLTDTGCRASEFLSINIAELELIKGEIEILHGKGNKLRTIFLGRNCRRAMRIYLKTRNGILENSPLWVAHDECRLTYSGLREIIRRRARGASIDEPGIHDFRRCFAIEFLRNEGDIFTLQRILGHSSLEMVKRYLAIAKSDCETAHRKASPVDNWTL
jgi:integrase/recombinase XerD